MTVLVQPGFHHYQFRIRADQHEWLADLDRTVGGDDTGPNPHHLLESALAVCTAQTLTMYAERKQWPLQGLHVQVASETVDGKTQLQRRIELIGDLDDSQREKLLQIADRCPIHRVLTGPIAVHSELSSSPLT
ncbi:MAG: OsmC family protein [Pseudomonadales bacterium]|nr:OsmC family protein [Pseudomonadales bacterium]